MIRRILAALLALALSGPALAQQKGGEPKAVPSGFSAGTVSLADVATRVMSVTDAPFGAKCDVFAYGSGAVYTAGSNTFVPNNGVAVSAEDIGKYLVAYAAGANGDSYVGTITGVTTVGGSPAWVLSANVSQSSTVSIVLSVTPWSLATTGNIAGTNQLTALASTTGIANGQLIHMVGVPEGTTVLSIAGSTVTMSAAATQTVTGGAVTFESGVTANYVPGDQITFSNGATTGGSQGQASVVFTQVQTASVAAGGTTSAANGTYYAIGTTGAGIRVKLKVTIFGGTMTAVALADNTAPNLGGAYAGAYSINPTTSGEAISGAGLSAAAVNLTMGPAQLVMVHRGGYSTFPTIAAQGSTTGSGLGAGFALAGAAPGQFNHGVAGSFYYGHDDSAAFAAGWAWAQLKGTSLRVPLEVGCGTTQPIIETGDRGRLIGSNGGTSRIGQPGSVAPSYGAALFWLGASGGGPLLEIGTPNGDVFHVGSGVEKLSLIGGNLASIAFQANTHSMLTLTQLFAQGCLVSCYDFDINTNVAAGSSESNEYIKADRLIFDEMLAPGHGLTMRCPGGAGTCTSDTALNIIDGTLGFQGDDTGIVLSNSDSNDLRWTTVLSFTAGPLYSVELSGIPAQYPVYQNWLDGLYATLPPVVRGTPTLGSVFGVTAGAPNIIDEMGDMRLPPWGEPGAAWTWKSNFAQDFYKASAAAVDTPDTMWGNNVAYPHPLAGTTAARGEFGDLAMLGAGAEAFTYNYVHKTGIDGSVPGNYYVNTGPAFALIDDGNNFLQIWAAPSGTAGAAAALAPYFTMNAATGAVGFGSQTNPVATVDIGGNLRVASGALSPVVIGQDSSGTSFMLLSFSGGLTAADSGLLGGAGSSDIYLEAGTGGVVHLRNGPTDVFDVGATGIPKLSQATPWVAASNCGSLASATKCIEFTDPNGNSMYLPAYGTY